jgi:hypothetical protein
LRHEEKRVGIDSGSMAVATTTGIVPKLMVLKVLVCVLPFCIYGSFRSIPEELRLCTSTASDGQDEVVPE